MTFGLQRDVLRSHESSHPDSVTYVELFFDLVFVFALTQLGAYLYENQTPLGALEGVTLLCALWWAWVSTTWVTNRLDPLRLPVRAAVIVLAFIAFVMSVSIAEAFGDRAWAFAIAYVVLQVGRTAFLVWATARHDPSAARDFAHVLAWTSAGAVLWIVGAMLPLPLQLPLWVAAVVLDLLGSALGYPVPGRGRVSIAAWDVSGPHIAERTALFVLIALGEGLLVTGFTFVDTESSVDAVVAMITAVVAAAACWWIYFDHGERIGSEAIEASESPGRLARTAYTWVHLAVVGGIVMLGVGDKEVLGHPHEQSFPAVVTVLGGPVLFLIGTLLFRRVLDRQWAVAQLGGLLALAVVAAFTPFIDPLTTGLLAAAVLVATAAGETFERVRRGSPRGG